MKAEDIYRIKPAMTTHDLNELVGCYYNHIPEVMGVDPYDFGVSSDRVEIRTVDRVDFDSRRFWQIATVYFDGEPVMIIQNAGREGDDHHERYVTDRAQLLAMCQHIQSLLPASSGVVEDDYSHFIGAGDDVPTTFYGGYLTRRPTE